MAKRKQRFAYHGRCSECGAPCSPIHNPVPPYREDEYPNELLGPGSVDRISVHQCSNKCVALARARYALGDTRPTVSRKWDNHQRMRGIKAHSVTTETGRMSVRHAPLQNIPRPRAKKCGS